MTAQSCHSNSPKWFWLLRRVEDLAQCQKPGCKLVVLHICSTLCLGLASLTISRPIVWLCHTAISQPLKNRLPCSLWGHSRLWVSSSQPNAKICHREVQNHQGLIRLYTLLCFHGTFLEDVTSAKYRSVAFTSDNHMCWNTISTISPTEVIEPSHSSDVLNLYFT